MRVAGSNSPPMPMVVLTTRRAVSLPKALILPCSRSLMITVGYERFWKKLLTPVRTGRGVTFT